MPQSRARKLVLAAALATTAILLAGCSAATATSKSDDAVGFPAKGRSITLIIPYDAGGAGDIGARLLQPYFEKELGTTITIQNMPGAGSQIGVSALARSKPDGYTIGFTHLPATITTYLDPTRQADFSLKNLTPVGMFVIDPNAFLVKGDSKYNNLKDLIADAKAHPGKVRVTDSGVLSDGHITTLRIEQEAGVQFAVVHSNGGAANVTNILGNNTDVGNLNISGNLPQLVASGQLKMIALFDSTKDKNFPKALTAKEQGFDIVVGSSRAISAPAGTPKAIVEKISNALQKAMNDPEFAKKAEAAGLRLSYMDPADTLAYWKQMEKDVKPLIALAR